ncbi:hypothetical protein DNTS_020749 [Danionella cerebrum]|uniref:Pseudouridine synthase II N-terminal domain-containing protein n=1 Tax=Danionella cerebrum TaxID=2873325 RepID=A0A553MP99_9TELE|nr:hypothetical protein DNTS_020749 [Danionella translucida]
MATKAVRLFRKFNGLFAVYKPQGVHWKLVRDTVETNILKVTGPQFQRLKVGVGRRLDAFSSGEYTVEGEFGKASDNFSNTGRIVERTTYGHITLDKLERVLAAIQGANQKALNMYSKVDMSTQEAYELAVKGLLYPEGQSPPIVTGLKCQEFNPPHFTLALECVNETQKYMCKLVHEIGLELRSSAVCTKVRRTRDGPFRVEDALTHNHWNADNILQAIAHFRKTTRKLKKSNNCRKSPTQSNLPTDHKEQDEDGKTDDENEEDVCNQEFVDEEKANY